MNKKLIDLTGQRYGRLTVIKQAPAYITSDGHYHFTKWWCRCDCGNEVAVVGQNLKRGVTKSCGCYRSEASRKRLRAAYDALAIVNEMGEKSERII